LPNLGTKRLKFPIFILQLSQFAKSVSKNRLIDKIVNCFCTFYNSIRIIEKFKSWKFTKFSSHSIQLFWSQLTNLIKSIIWQFKNSIIQIALVIFQCLLSIHQIAKLQSIIWIDWNGNTETFSTIFPWKYLNRIGCFSRLNWYKKVSGIFFLDKLIEGKKWYFLCFDQKKTCQTL
jgi:hypothetical protein